MGCCVDSKTGVGGGVSGSGGRCQGGTAHTEVGERDTGAWRVRGNGVRRGCRTSEGAEVGFRLHRQGAGDANEMQLQEAGGGERCVME